MIVFAAISPHPPLLLPSVGSEEDKEKVKKTLTALDLLSKKLKGSKPDSIIISSPHRDWGFNVPLYFLAKGFKGEIRRYLTSFEPSEVHFTNGAKLAKTIKGKKCALVASGDLSHCLKKDGPYGFNPQGPKFDKDLIESLKKKDIKKLLKLNELYPEAGECGLRSFSFLLGILEELKINWRPEILSYQAPFGVGYLVANFKII